jgi:hypothetical protein
MGALSIDSGDLRSFNAYARHQPLLIENERVGVFFQG